MKFSTSERLHTVLVGIVIFVVLSGASGDTRDGVGGIETLAVAFTACVGAYLSHRTRTNSATPTEANVWRWMRTVLTGMGVFMFLILVSLPLGGLGAVEVLVVVVVAGALACLDHRRRVKREEHLRGAWTRQGR